MSVDIEGIKAVLAAVLSNTVGAIDQLGTAQFFQAALDAVNADHSDGHTTPVPAAVYAYERAVLEAYPAVELQGLTTTYDPTDDVKGATHTIAVVWTVVGDNEATVTTDVERLVRATRDVFWRSVLNAGVGTVPVLVESEDYSALAPGQPASANPFMKGGRVLLVVGSFS